jgi:hypothetical protein
MSPKKAQPKWIPRTIRVCEPRAENKVKFRYFDRVIQADACAVSLSLSLEGGPIAVQEGYHRKDGRFRVTHTILVSAKVETD